MTQQVGQGGTIVLDAVYRDGANALVDPVGPLVSILRPDNSVAVAPTMPTHDGLGMYSYSFVAPLAAPLGTWKARWTGTINGAPVVDDDPFVVAAAGGVGFPEGGCTPWITGDDLPAACVANLPPTMTADDLAVAAWQVLFPLSGSRFCSSTVVVLPERLGGECGCIPGPRAVLDALAGCGCQSYEVVLAGPVSAVNVVMIGGVQLSPAAYQVRDGRRLVRIDGEPWPCCANQPGEAPSFTIEYVRGEPVTQMGVMAAIELACELAKSVREDEECQLPRSVQSITRQQLTISFNPRDVFTEGLTGLPVSDLFIVSTNPSRKVSRRGASIGWPGMPGLSVPQ